MWVVPLGPNIFWLVKYYVPYASFHEISRIALRSRSSNYSITATGVGRHDVRSDPIRQFQVADWSGGSARLSGARWLVGAAHVVIRTGLFKKRRRLIESSSY